MAVAVLATAVMVTVNFATADATTGPLAWVIVGVVTLASAAASLWLYRRTQDPTTSAPAGADTTVRGAGSGVQISGNTFLGPAAVQGKGKQRNRFGS